MCKKLFKILIARCFIATNRIISSKLTTFVFQNVRKYILNKYNYISYRVTHYYDIVPHIPEEFMGYSHISNEIWYNEINSIYNICNDNVNEDSKCSNSCAPTKCTSTSDHLYYLNISMGN